MAQVLSSRGSRLLSLPKPAFTAIYYASLGSMYDPVSNPGGIVNLAVAENRLAMPRMRKRLEAAGACATPETLAYNPYAGSDRLRRAMANVVSRKIAHGAVKPANLLLTNGAGSALWLLASMLAEPGEGIMVPTPYYYAYDRDLTSLTECKLVLVDGCGGSDPLDPKALTAAKDAAQAQGTRCRLLVLTNPSNPTGEVVQAERLKKAIDWAGQNSVDVISNELYACSTVPGGSFQSVLSLYKEAGAEAACDLPEHVHFVWGLSKDFAVNGLRVGCVYSHSAQLVEAASKFLYFFQVGGPVQAQLSECLEDEAWVDQFLEESRRQVREAVDATEAALRSVGAPYVPSEGALFVWADLSEWASRAGGELALFKHLSALPGGGVLLCPGESFRAREGWFRICVSASPEGHLGAGLERLLEGLRTVPAAA